MWNKVIGALSKYFPSLSTYEACHRFDFHDHSLLHLRFFVWLSLLHLYYICRCVIIKSFDRSVAWIFFTFDVLTVTNHFYPVQIFVFLSFLKLKWQPITTFSEL